MDAPCDALMGNLRPDRKRSTGSMGNSRKARRTWTPLQADTDGRTAETFQCRMRAVGNVRRRRIPERFDPGLYCERHSPPRAEAARQQAGGQADRAAPRRRAPRAFHEAIESARIRELVRRTEVSCAKESQLGDNGRSRVEGGAEAMPTTPAGRNLDSLRAEIAAWSANVSLCRRGVRQRTKTDGAPCRLKTGPQ